MAAFEGFELDRAGVAEILRSPEVAAAVDEPDEAVGAAASAQGHRVTSGEPPPVEVFDDPNRNRYGNAKCDYPRLNADALDAATLHEVTRHITEVITHGDLQQQEALVEGLVAQVKITAPDRVIPVFRIPNPEKTNTWTGTNTPNPA